ncbi:MAG: DUF2974 domain-containing protein [Clostridia bacterium]|nr:DUF2974 domain-containing protein [Clostridia bacterium]
MDTILDYIRWMRDVPFSVKDVTEVDSIVFSFLSYMNLKGIVTKDRQMTVAQCCRALLAHPESLSAHHQALYEALADSRRFGPVVIGSYKDSLQEEKDVQFCVMLFKVRKNLHYIAFRGTDNTLTGWKEDFMTCFTLTGGQRMALTYLKSHIRPGIRYDIGGHSKGGNLAMYALSRIGDEKLRQVRHIYLQDAPGLCPDVMDVSSLERIRPKCISMRPAFSVIGRLFDPGMPDVRLVQSSADGIMQHDIETWGVDHGDLLLAAAPDPAAERIVETAEGWLEGVSTEERRHFVDDVFRAVESGGARTVEDLSSGSVDSMLATFRSSAGKETLDATARLPFAALFGKYTDKVWNLRLIRWLRTSDTAADILLLVCGFLLHMLPIHSMGVIVSLVLTSLVTFEVLVTLRHLLDSHWDLKSEHVRVNTCIMMIAIAYVLFVKEQALFNLSTTIFGILFLVLAYNNAIVLRSCQLWTVPWIRHLMMTAMFAFVGFFVMVSAEHEISWYASMAGNLLMFDGISGLAHEMQKRKHRSQKKKGVKNTP